MRAVRDIQRLCLFPIVFTVGPVMSAALGDSYGEQCSSVMLAAEALLHEQQMQASPAGPKISMRGFIISTVLCH